MSNLLELADRLGVSVATVSRALNDKPGVSAETRQKVLGLAEKLRYHPNLAARSLATSRNPQVLFIVHRQQLEIGRDPSCIYIMGGLEETLTNKGYNVILVTLTDPQMIAGPPSVRVMRDQRPGAIVFAGSGISSDFISETTKSNTPILLVDIDQRESSIPAVLPDNEGGCRAATTHLLEVHGHQHVALLRGPTDWIRCEERTNGYSMAMEAAGLQPFLIPATDSIITSGQAATAQALLTKPEITAIVATNDALAIGASRAGRQLGRAVPGDLAVVGFDNISWAAYSDPPLSTVGVPMREMGRLTGQILLDRINGNLIAATSTIAATRLIIRASCGCPESTGIYATQDTDILEGASV